MVNINGTKRSGRIVLLLDVSVGVDADEVADVDADEVANVDADEVADEDVDEVVDEDADVEVDEGEKHAVSPKSIFVEPVADVEEPVINVQEEDEAEKATVEVVLHDVHCASEHVY
ncbi:MAG: hypothetical protein Q9198_001123 [Flavoplaca austrocitrina]